MVLCFSVRTASTLLFLSFSSPSAKALATYRRALVRFSSTKQQFILPFSTRTAPVLLRRRRTSQHHQHHQSALQNQGSRLKSVMKSTPEDFDDFASVQDLSYRDMQKWCKERGIPANGTTDAIRSRLVEHINMNANGVSKTKSLKTEKQSQKKTPSPKSKSKARTRTKPEANADADGANPNPRTSSSTPKRKSLSPKTPTSSSSRKRQRIQPGSLKPPEDYLQLYSIVEELRADRTAPLDSDGGEALPQRDQGTTIYRFQVLVALMLSSQTKDAAVGEAMRALQQHGLTVENIHATESTVLNGLIQKVGFHNNKTKYLKKTAETLISEYGGDIPSTAEEMMKLTGIGPKMAYIIETIAFGTSSGIGVDTHMHRMFNALKWVKSKNPEQTREQLEGWMPREKWSEVNMLWVGFGQESQQQKEKILKKALESSRPVEALGLLKRVGLDVRKEGKKYGLEGEIKKAYHTRNKNEDE